MMDEIICPACGRPNLAEAVKCWYCQELLEKPAGQQEDAEPEDPAAAPMEMVEGEQIAPGESRENEIPEWLKRVRAMKETEQQKEEERIRWQQQGLFSSATQPARPNARLETRKRAAPSAPAPKPAPPATQQPPAESPPPTRQPALSNEDLPAPSAREESADANREIRDDASDELPDGFIPFDRQ